MLLIAHDMSLAALADRVVTIDGRPDREVGAVSATLRRLVALSGMPKRRVALSIALAALTVLLGVGLIATSGYLISRAAEQPPILSLTVTIVFVRFFGLSRPLARYLDRLVSHDLALRSLGHVRSRFYERIEPLAPAQLEGFRRGDLVSRMVADVDALQGLYLSGIGPPAAAIVIAVVSVTTAALILPAAGLILAVGLVVAGVLVPLASGGALAVDRCAPGVRTGRADRRPRRAAARRSGARRLRPSRRAPRGRPRSRSRARALTHAVTASSPGSEQGCSCSWPG